MINVQEIRRNVINVVKNYSDAQVKVRKATSNEPWGPTSTLMSEIADLTYNVVAFSEIMQIIWKRLNDHGKNWRHVYKALVLLEYLIKTGSEKVAQQCRDNLFAIQTLKDFQYFEDNKDQGLSIREKSKLLVNLLKDEEKLKSERAKALKAKECFSQSLSHMGTSVEGSDTIKSSSSFHESIALSEAGPSRNINSELESARPQTVGEEELQLQLALAMSKEEAEQEDRLRKNDDLRLKLALEESEKNGTIKSESRSAVDELLSLNPTPSTSNELALSDPWGAPLNNTSLIPSPPNKNKQSPWGPTSANVNILLDNKENNSFDDPWSSNGTKVPTSNDPWNLNDPSDLTTSTNDPWNLMNESTGNDSLVNKPVNMVSESIRRTPESFLGPNSNLVNLDALVSNKTQTSSPSNNPFAPAAPVSVSNPFQTSKPSQPTINELRAQSSQLGGSPLPGYASGSAALNSLFNSPSVSSPANPMPFVHNTLTGSNLVPTPAPGNNAAWGNFASQQTSPFPPTFSSNATQPNNPFAM